MQTAGYPSGPGLPMRNCALPGSRVTFATRLDVWRYSGTAGRGSAIRDKGMGLLTFSLLRDLIRGDAALPETELADGVIADRRQFIIVIGSGERVHEHGALAGLDVGPLRQHLDDIGAVWIAYGCCTAQCRPLRLPALISSRC